MGKAAGEPVQGTVVSATRQPRILGHRGASGYAPENSLEAFDLAARMGANGVELDVHGSADGVMVVHHDPTLPDLGAIADLSFPTIQKARLPNGESPPRLEEVLGIMPGLEIWIEVKVLLEGQEGILLGTIAAARDPGRCRVHSFDHALIRRLHTRAPDLPLGLLTSGAIDDPVGLLAEHGAKTLWPEQGLVSAGLVSRLHQAGMEVIAWTVNQRAEAQRLAEAGVDGLCGNYPDRLRLS